MSGLKMDIPQELETEHPLPQKSSPHRVFDPGLFIILAGAVLMMIAMFMDFYKIHIQYQLPPIKSHENIFPSEHILNLDLARLTDLGQLNMLGLHRPATIVPLVLLFFIALIGVFTALYSVLYFAATGKQIKRRLFTWISLLSLAILTANFLYLFVVFMKNDNIDYFRPQVGWILAFSGAAAIGLGSFQQYLQPCREKGLSRN